MCKKESFVVSAAIVMAVAVMMFFPLTGTAGSLEPNAAPAPTMKTLNQIPPTWSQILPASERFQELIRVVDDKIVTWGVLDKETGLVWEQSPGTTTVDWTTAMFSCQNKSAGNRKGWHLPTVEQLASLVDTSVSEPPKLPAGHPFSGVLSSNYWSATTQATFTTAAWHVNLNFGSVTSSDKSNEFYVWCVRGGQAYDGQ